jgi:hypothetical protein
MNYRVIHEPYFVFCINIQYIALLALYYIDLVLLDIVFFITLDLNN